MIHYNQTVDKDKENLESSIVTSYVKEILNKIINGFLSRNIEGQKALNALASTCASQKYLEVNTCLLFSFYLPTSHSTTHAPSLVGSTSKIHLNLSPFPFLFIAIALI